MLEFTHIYKIAHIESEFKFEHLEGRCTKQKVGGSKDPVILRLRTCSVVLLSPIFGHIGYRLDAENLDRLSREQCVCGLGGAVTF